MRIHMTLLPVALIATSCTLVGSAGFGTSPDRRPATSKPDARAATSTAAPPDEPAQQGGPALAASSAPNEGAGGPPWDGPGCEEPTWSGTLAREHRTCDRAVNHCLSPDIWFVHSVNQTVVVPAFECGGQLYEWILLHKATGPKYLSRPARDEELQVGATVIYYLPQTARHALPLSEAYAHRQYWRIGKIDKVYPDRHEFQAGGRTHYIPFEAARLVIDSRQ